MSNEYGEGTKGVGPIPIPQGVYEMSETAQGTLGTRVAFADGRVFRYAKAGATGLAPGKLVKMGLIADQTNLAVEAAVGVGGYEVTLTSTYAGTTWAEGYLQINDAAGEGIQYKIEKGAANSSTATSTDLTLYDPIATALTTSSQASIIHNPYEQLEISSAITDVLVGVPPITVTAEYYFWVQTWGVGCVLSEGITPAGQVVEVAIGDGAAGTTSNNADTALGLGVQMNVGVNTEYKSVWLMFAP